MGGRGGLCAYKPTGEVLGGLGLFGLVRDREGFGWSSRVVERERGGQGMSGLTD
jgi:hypothetical protein